MPAFIGVDVGSKRVGVAAATAGIATPAATIERSGDLQQDARAVAREAAQREANVAVVGLPLKLDGSRGPAVEAAEEFADALRACGLHVVFWDERLSTVEAERVLIEGGTRRADRKKVIDKVAATVILQSYLDANR